LSLIVPCFNEAKLIGKNIEEITRFLHSKGIEFEIIIANDGSSDETVSVVAEMAAENQRIRIIDSFKHEGKGAALSRAFLHSRYEILAFIDADLEIAIHYLWPLFKMVRNGKDIAIASKGLGSVNENRSIKRRLATKGYNLLVRWLLNSKLSDHQAGLKVFRREVLLDILNQMYNPGWTWDTEVLIRAQKKGYSIAEYPVQTNFKRTSSISLFRHALQMAIGVVNLHRRGIRI